MQATKDNYLWLGDNGECELACTKDLAIHSDGAILISCPSSKLDISAKRTKIKGKLQSPNIEDEG